MEAAIVLPIFLYAIITFLYFIQIFIVEEKIQAGITEVAKYSAKYAYVYEYIEHYESNEKTTKNEDTNTKVADTKETDTKDIDTKGTKKIDAETKDTKTKDNEVDQAGEQEESLDLSNLILIDNIFYKQKLKDYIEEDFINLSCVVNGYSGLDFFYSSYLTEDDMVDIVVKYKVQFPSVIFKIANIQIVQRVRVRGFVGYDRASLLEEAEENDDEEVVYITETGTVYHATKSCTHLKLSINKALYGEIIDLRNSSGGKYKECEICSENTSLDEHSLVYITGTGDRYHVNPSCSGLKRTIIEIPFSKIASRTPCKRCYKK